jgi:uncharacterized protein YndB with AHSA1/START domain
MDSATLERVIRVEAQVDAEPKQVWEAWTTSEGIMSFFARACNVDLSVDGVYEILFDPDAEPGLRGGEGNRFLAIQPENMLSFTWNAPPHLPEVRKHLTHVVVRLDREADGRTRVMLTHDGWGSGGEWDAAFDYFVRAWRDVVLPRLKYRFAVGPVDWANPPDLG